MGMTIDKAIDIMEHYKEYGFVSQANGRNKAIDTMRKYQQIEQILKDIPYGGDATVRRIQEVIEDGNDNKEQTDE